MRGSLLRDWEKEPRALSCTNTLPSSLTRCLVAIIWVSCCCLCRGYWPRCCCCSWCWQVPICQRHKVAWAEVTAYTVLVNDNCANATTRACITCHGMAEGPHDKVLGFLF
jgi:hypothetical protein